MKREKTKRLIDLISRMKAASERARRKELPNVYFRKGERPACRHCRWEGETVTELSHCQGLAKCNAHTFSRKPKNA